MSAFTIPTVSKFLQGATAATANTIPVRDNNGGITNSTCTAASQVSTGAVYKSTLAQSAAFSASTSATVYLCSASSAAYAATLPPASASTGLELVFVKTDSSSNHVTVTGAGSDNINGSNTYALTTQYQAVHVVSDGTQWWVIP